MAPPSLVIEKLPVAEGKDTKEASPVDIPCYFAQSTAPLNIDRDRSDDHRSNHLMKDGITAIAEEIYKIHKNSAKAPPELVIAVHGYNTLGNNVKRWYELISQFINQDPNLLENRNVIFIGYRWPSEKIGSENLGSSYKSLPPLPKWILNISILTLLLLFFRRLFIANSGPADLLVYFSISLSTFLGATILSLVLLRYVAYFRDYYRATTSGVSDLVELIRQIDSAVIHLTKAEYSKENWPSGYNSSLSTHNSYEEWLIDKVKLNFLGHSMGSVVITKAINFIGDKFDIRDIKNVPTSDIGSIFRLERLVLASPDLPAQVIASSRNNDITACLKRFAEVFVFTNEGDIALRLASTAANYFFFPVRSRIAGYRLGNVSINSQTHGITNITELYQIVEGLPIREAILASGSFADRLALTYTTGVPTKVETLRNIFKISGDLGIVDIATFIDCTDYKDFELARNPRLSKNSEQNSKPRGVLSKAKKKRALNIFDYFGLTLDYARDKRDVHGGYFEGEFSHKLVYRLAFLGIFSTLNFSACDNKPVDPHVALANLDTRCRDAGIKILLSPLHYLIAVERNALSSVYSEFLNQLNLDEEQL